MKRLNKITNWFKVNSNEIQELAIIAGTAIILVATTRAIANDIERINNKLAKGINQDLASGRAFLAVDGKMVRSIETANFAHSILNA